MMEIRFQYEFGPTIANAAARVGTDLGRAPIWLGGNTPAIGLRMRLIMQRLGGHCQQNLVQGELATWRAQWGDAMGKASTQ